MARAGIIGSRAGVGSRSSFPARGLPGQASTSGTPAVALATDVHKLAQDLVQQAADAVSDSFSDRIPPYLKEVRATWPVKTGYSASRFRINVENVGDLFVFHIVNDAPYSGWIRHKKERPVLDAVRLLFDPFAEVASEIAHDIADLVGT